MSLSFLGKQDVYIEVAKRYKEYILKGIYKNAEKLPSVRAVASELGVNPNTVAKAYALLESEGFIRALPKKGAFVIYQGDLHKEGNGELSEAVAELKNKGFSYEEIISAVKEVFDKNVED